MKGIVGGNTKDSGDVRFGEEVLQVVYRGDTHGRARGIILSYISNRWRELIKHRLDINEIIYWYCWISQFLGTNIHWLTSLVESDGKRSTLSDWRRSDHGQDNNKITLNYKKNPFKLTDIEYDRIKYEMSRMERVEYNTASRRNVMNVDDIEDLGNP